MDAQWPSGQSVEGGTSYTATLKHPLSGNINLDVMTLKMTAGRDCKFTTTDNYKTSQS